MKIPGNVEPLRNKENILKLISSYPLKKVLVIAGKRLDYFKKPLIISQVYQP